MFHAAGSFYARARLRRPDAASGSLRDELSIPPERLLQLIWFHQRLKRDELGLADGRKLRILHPGFWNHEAGPDFRGAVLQFGDDRPRTGDVEIDLAASGWGLHKHDRNPNFSKVLLHVVWEGEDDTTLPALSLKTQLDSPLNELAAWLGGDATPVLPSALEGQCCAPLAEVTETRIGELLNQAAMVRLQAKAAQLKARARHATWEQALWEGMFRALGYKQNGWPMQRLAELRHTLRGTARRPSLLGIQARLLGSSGLLPADFSKSATGGYVRKLWDAWWRERDAFADCALPKAIWHMHGLRPANHPQRRLALAAHWLGSDDLPRRLEQWAAKSGKSASLLAVLQVKNDAFWSWHWTLRSKRLPKPQPLLGAARVTDLAINVILPWLWARAADKEDDACRIEIETRYLNWPAGEDNAILRLARERLLGKRCLSGLRTAAAQQGLLQIVRDFCDQSNSLCQNCQFPQVVRQWSEG